MARAWVKRWSPHRNGGKGSLVPALNITSNAAIESMTWKLPPRRVTPYAGWPWQPNPTNLFVLTTWLLQAKTLFHAPLLEAARRPHYRPRCVRSSNPAVSNHDDQPPLGTVSWEVEGAGPHGLHAPVSVLHAGNSGTALRILMAMCARFDVPIMVDGDASLRSRNHDVMVSALEALGVTASRGVGVEGLPLLLQGPWKPTKDSPSMSRPQVNPRRRFAWPPLP